MSQVAPKGGRSARVLALLGNNWIKVCLRDPVTKNARGYYIKVNTAMSKLKWRWCIKMGGTPDKLIFVYNGELIGDEDTVTTLNMKDKTNNVIKVFEK